MLIHIERRREQNRLSQRAFRTRREGYQLKLEAEVEEWTKRVDQLSSLCRPQREAIQILGAEMVYLSNERTDL